MFTEDERRERKRQSNARYRETHRRQLAEKERERQARDIEGTRQKARDRYAAHTPEQRANHQKKNRQWREENAARVRETNRAWELSHPDLVREYAILRSHTRRAREANVPSERFTESDMLRRWGTDCYLCGAPVDIEAPRTPGKPGWEIGLHRDHVIPISAGGPNTLDNVRPAHAMCNLRKADTPITLHLALWSGRE